jgi:hypothetical protein
MSQLIKIRKILKGHRLPYNIHKVKGTCIVAGPDCSMWYSQSFIGLPKDPADCVDQIVECAIKNRDRVLAAMPNQDPEWQQEIQNAILAIDSYLEWKKKIAK